MAGRRAVGTGTVRKLTSGKHAGKFEARLRWRDHTNTRCEVRRVFERERDARMEVDRLVRARGERGPAAIDGDRMTFADLAKHFERHHLIEAVVRNGRKIAGYRGLRDVLPRFRAARDYFGRRLLRSITYDDLAMYRRDRFTGREGSIRSTASVNRDLALLRRMFTIAEQQGWMTRNPFRGGEPLIVLAHENKRDRILGIDEEARLLSACADIDECLLAVVLTALDTGARRGELMLLEWADVDIEGRVITIRAENAKTERTRTVRLTDRVARAIEGLRPETADGRVFGSLEIMRRGFARARQIAGLESFQFRDLRTTCSTRLTAGGLPIAEVARWLGHANVETTFRHYTSPDDAARLRAVEILERASGRQDNGDLTQRVN